MYQSTLFRPIHYTGIGLHSGKDVELKLIPAAVNTGIVFHIHTPKGVHTLQSSPEVVSATALATTLSAGQAHVSTVEHLLAALNALAVDNVEVHVYGGEIPIMDGSARPLMDLLVKTGRRPQPAFRKVARIQRPFSVAGEGKAIHAWPHKGFFVDYSIDFTHQAIGRQRLALEINPGTFAEIASARTFGFLQEVEYLHSKGLALGGSLNNAVVLDEQGVVNPEGLRCPDEFVRHKILDFVGDMAMLGMPMEGAFEVHCSGHQHNNTFLRHLVNAGSNYLKVVTLDEEQTENSPAPLAKAAFVPAFAPA